MLKERSWLLASVLMNAAAIAATVYAVALGIVWFGPASDFQSVEDCWAIAASVVLPVALTVGLVMILVPSARRKGRALLIATGLLLMAFLVYAQLALSSLAEG